MPKDISYTCPECGKITTMLRKGGFTSHCTCNPIFIPDISQKVEGRHIQLDLSDSTKSTERFGS